MHLGEEIEKYCCVTDELPTVDIETRLKRLESCVIPSLQEAVVLIESLQAAVAVLQDETLSLDARVDALESPPP